MVNKRLIEIAGRWKNPSLPKKKKQPKEQPKLTQILERDLDGKPKITLNELEKTAVNTPTQEKYNTLMQVYECGGWEWTDGRSPTQENYWNSYKKKTCVKAKDEFGFGTVGIGFKEKKIISTQEFYDSQNPPITPEMLKEINQWFKYGK